MTSLEVASSPIVGSLLAAVSWLLIAVLGLVPAGNAVNRLAAAADLTRGIRQADPR